jgi:hypothetical protein
MKLSLQLLFLGAAVVTVDSTSPKYVPARISFEDLANNENNDIFWKTLRDVGLLSITDIPDFNKQSMLKDLEDCLHNHQTNVGAPDFNLNHLGSGRGNSDGDSDGDNDNSNPSDEGGGRRRRTMAGTPEGILVATKNHKDEENDVPASSGVVCSDLKASSEVFRKAVQRVSEAIAVRFGGVESAALRGDSKIPIESLINDGEHLEHFHSYYNSDKNEASTQNNNNNNNNIGTATIDWHTDQGMMLLFTPGQRKDGTTPNGFFIKLADGSTAEVAFDSQIDDLVIMLGDGVHQYINNNDNDNVNLRAVPHSVSLPNNNGNGNNNENETPRLWYGRMVLPPPEAIHPSGNGSTFEELRTAMIRGDTDALSLGCASASMVARELVEDHGDDISCDEDISMLCWMSCMNYSDLGVSVDDCASQSDDHSLVCANEAAEVWEYGHQSSEYTLRCVSKEETVHAPEDEDMDHSSAASGYASATIIGLFGMIATSIVLQFS